MARKRRARGRAGERHSIVHSRRSSLKEFGTKKSKTMSETVTCYCGALKITVTGEPAMTPVSRTSSGLQSTTHHLPTPTPTGQIISHFSAALVDRCVTARIAGAGMVASVRPQNCTHQKMSRSRARPWESHGMASTQTPDSLPNS